MGEKYINPSLYLFSNVNEVWRVFLLDFVDFPGLQPLCNPMYNALWCGNKKCRPFQDGISDCSFVCLGALQNSVIIP